MKNNKGFTLMELLVAVFIGSMVTISLVSIWKAASLQTSSGQRQSVIRNNLSMFLRGIHKDLTEADVIIYPTKLLTSEPNILLVGFRNARKVGDTIEPKNSNLTSFIPSSQYFAYCYDSTKKRVLKRESNYPATKTISDFLSDLGDCSGSNVMDNVDSKPTISTGDNVNYDIAIRIHKDFNDKTPPVHIEFERKFIISGGV